MSVTLGYFKRRTDGPFIPEVVSMFPEGRFCCKSLFALVIKIFFGCTRDFRVKLPPCTLTAAVNATLGALAEVLVRHGGGSGIAFDWEMQLLGSKAKAA
jgi:hypothetical protein